MKPSIASIKKLFRPRPLSRAGFSHDSFVIDDILADFASVKAKFSDINQDFSMIKPVLSLFSAFFLIMFSFSILGISRELATSDPRRMYQHPGMQQKIAFSQRLQSMVAGYPIEKMLPYLIKQDEKVATYMVSIAKKESNWGKRKPVLNGEDCFNYWGFRRKAERMGSGGHTCFDDPKEAVMTVGSRINHLIYEENIDTPEKMIVWKCGSSCDGHGSYDVDKWIQDVRLYNGKIEN